MSKSKKRQSLEKKLKAYSAVAAGTLLLAPSANAAVQYSGIQNIQVNANNTPVFLDLDINATNDFSFSYDTFYYGKQHFIEGIGSGNSVIDSWVSIFAPPLIQDPSRVPKSYFFNANLPSNYNIQDSLQASKRWSTFGIPDLSYSGLQDVLPPGVAAVSTGPEGNFIDTSGYIGIRFDTACGEAFGWIQYAANADATNGTIIDWAYEDNCGAPILAGDQGAPAVGVPTLNQWGLFALVALLAGAGVMRLRKQEEV